MPERVRLPGGRDVRGTVDRADPDAAAPAIVVACPPHPQMGGDRSDPRLRAVSDALTAAGIDCLRFDYGPWDEGRGETADVATAIEWAADQSDAVGLFGYSFGAGVAILAAADAPGLAATSLLAPPARVGESDTPAAIESIACPLQVLYGERDESVDWEAVLARARTADAAITGVGTDHFFAGRQDAIATAACEFFQQQLDYSEH